MWHKKSMTIALQRVLMYKKRTWILLLKCRQTLRECLTLVRLTQKNIIVDFFFKWFSMILWSMMDDLMMHEMLWFCFWNYMICLHGCVNASVKFVFFFHFFINLRNVGGVMHMHTLWIIDYEWHAMIFFLNLDDDACMDAWMHVWNLLFKKMNYSCMHDLVWCMNYSFTFFLKTNSNWFPFHCYFKFMESFYFDFFLLFEIIFLV